MTWKPKRRRLFVWWLIALSGVCLLIVLGVPVIVWQSLHPARFALRGTPQDEGLAYQALTFPSRDGFPLAGWWVPAHPAKATLILCHGYPSDRRDVMPLIPFLHHAGYNVLAFDFRRLGESGGDMSTIGLREPGDLLGAVDCAGRLSNVPIATLGESMGAAACIMAAAREPRIGAVIADSPYTSLDIQAARRFGSGPLSRLCGSYACWLGERILKERLCNASPLRAVKHLAARPLLLIHSAKDRLIPYTDSEAIMRAATGPKELWITQASGHVRSYAELTHEYERRTLAFLDGWLAKRSAMRQASTVNP